VAAWSSLFQNFVDKEDTFQHVNSAPSDLRYCNITSTSYVVVYRGNACLSFNTPRNILLNIGCFPNVTPLIGVMIDDDNTCLAVLMEYPDVEFLNNFERKSAPT